MFHSHGTELWELGLYDEARWEFEDLREAVNTSPTDSFRLANHLADIGLYRSAVFAARQVLTLAGQGSDTSALMAPPYFNHIRYGLYYFDLIIPEAQAHKLEPLFVLSIVRQESLFEGFVGFSAAPPDRLYASVLTESEYHYAGHNVRACEHKPTSFLNWLRRMIKVHRAAPVFRSRVMRVLRIANPRVLAFVRESDAGFVLCLHNLSRFVQPALVPVDEWRGRTPVEIIGGERFPPMTHAEYHFTLGPHSLLWLRLEHV